MADAPEKIWAAGADHGSGNSAGTWFAKDKVGVEYVRADIAAAQADYERRILSALSQPHPADERVVEAMPYAWANVRVEDTGDGLIIHPDDARKWGLDNDRDYTGSFLPDGRFRIALAQEGRKNG